MLRHDRIAARIGLRCGGQLPRILRHGALIDADQRLAGDSIEDVSPAGLAHLRKAFALLASDLGIEQHHRVGRVIVPDVMVHFLKVPAVLAGARLNGDDGRGVQVVTTAHSTIEVRARVARREIQQPQFAIDSRCVPDRAAAVLPGIAVFGPGVVARFTRTGHRIERPQRLAVACIKGFDAPAHAQFATGNASDDHAVVVQRRSGQRKAFLPTFDLYGPGLFAGLHIERNQTAVERAEKHFAIAQADTAVGPATAHGADLGVEIGRVFPQDVAADHIERKHIVCTGDDVDDAIVHQGLCLARVLRCQARALQMCAPHALELRHIAAVDARQRRIALVKQTAAVGGPAVLRQFA